MNSKELTPKEREYLDCETPLLSGKKAALRLVSGFFTSFGKSLIVPSSAYGNAERKMTRTIREITYTKYKKAVLRKQSGTPNKNDEKLLKKLNSKDFVLAEDTFDADEFTKHIYEEYMKNREQRTENREQ